MNTLYKYAELIIKKGLNIYPGQSLNIETGIDDYQFAAILTEAAYKFGAKFVNLAVNSNNLLKHRLDYTKEEYLNYSPKFQEIRMLEMVADDWATVRIDNTADSEILKDADAARLDILVRNNRQVRRKLLDACSGNKIAWCVVCAPNKKWADMILGESNDSLDKFNKIFEKILRLDNKNPLEIWDKHGATLDRRAEVLNELKIKKLLINSKTADLEVTLIPTSVWTGGLSKTQDGRPFWANLPTEELFTTPHRLGTKGKIKIVKPVKVMEKTIEEPSFEFKDGKVINFDSKSNRDILQKYLSADEGSSYLGEIALVDISSPIYQTGLIFNSILFDENASSHIAIGNGYGFCLSNGNTLKSSDDFIKEGCNVSSVHTDFMFGTDDTEITAISENGSKHTIMKDGHFTC